MAVLSTPATAATVNQLLTRVRRLVGDTDSDTDNQRWSNTDILSALDDMLAQMFSEWTSQSPSAFMAITTMTYTASAASTALPAAVLQSQIYKVEKVEGTSNIFLPYRSNSELDRYSDEPGWSFVGGAIAVRPIPTDAPTLRIHALTAYIPISTSAAPSTDQHAIPVNYEEVLCLGAAIRLQENDNEVPATRLGRYAGLWEQFQKNAARHRGRTYVKNTRMLRP